jgi:hypothetical protein
VDVPTGPGYEVNRAVDTFEALTNKTLYPCLARNLHAGPVFHIGAVGWQSSY